MHNITPLQQLLDSDIPARDLGWMIDDILCEYGYYLATHEDDRSLTDIAKDHLYWLKKIRDCLYIIGGVKEVN